MSFGPDSTPVGLHNAFRNEQAEPGSLQVAAACLPVAIENIGDVTLAILSRTHEGWFPRFMDQAS